MVGISISPIELLIKGTPEGFLFVLAVYILTRTKIDWLKYVIQSLIFIVMTYALRLLPINIGTHTMLSLLALIILFMAFNKVSLQKLISAITSVIIIAIIVFISEELNLLLLIAIWGQSKTNALLSGTSIMVSVYEIPSTVIFALVILASYFVLAKIDKNKKVKNGEIGAKTGE